MNTESRPGHLSLRQDFPADHYRLITLSDIKSHPDHCRKDYPEEAIIGLAENIYATGLLQPVLLKPTETGYQLITGERRFRAYQKLNLLYQKDFDSIPARIISPEWDNHLMSFSENIQRASLRVMEESLGLAELLRVTAMRPDSLAKLIGKKPDYVERRLQYLRIMDSLKSHLASFSPTEDFFYRLHNLPISKVLPLKVLVTSWTDKESYDLLTKILDEDLSVREIRHILSLQNEERVMRKLGDHVPGQDYHETLHIDSPKTLNHKASAIAPTLGKPVDKSLKASDSPNLVFDDNFWDEFKSFLQDNLHMKVEDDISFQKALSGLICRHCSVID